MFNKLQFSVLASFGLVSLLAGCSGSEASDSSPSTTDATMTAEQACLATHTAKGKLDIDGKTCDVCGANRMDVAASFEAGKSIDFPRAKFGLGLDVDLVTVRLTDVHGKFEILKKLDSGSKCGSKVGWHFDSDTHPTKINLCNCDSSASIDVAAYVDVLVGCPFAKDGAGTSTTGAGSTTSTGTGTASTGTGSTSTGSTSTCTTGTCGSGNIGFGIDVEFSAGFKAGTGTQTTSTGTSAGAGVQVKVATEVDVSGSGCGFTNLWDALFCPCKNSGTTGTAAGGSSASASGSGSVSTGTNSGSGGTSATGTGNGSTTAGVILTNL